MTMGELSQVRTALDEIKKVEHVTEVSLVSRGGMYIMGGPPRGVHRETFSAMSAIIFGAAETTSIEMKDKLIKVVLELGEQKMTLLNVGLKYLLVVSIDKDGDVEAISRDARESIAKVESVL